MSIQDAAPLIPQLTRQRESGGGGHGHGLTVLTTAVFAVGEMAGSGVLALPSAISGTGWIGVLLMCVCAFTSAYTGDVLGRCWVLVQSRYEEYQDQPRYPYPAIGQVTYGRVGRILVTFCINFTMFGGAVVYLLLASQNINDLLADFGVTLSFCWWLVIVAALLCPICWLGTPKDFWPIAVAAALATTVACVIMVINMSEDAKIIPEAFHAPANFNGFLMAFGTIFFAFGGHPAFPTFQADMKRPEKFGRAISIAYLIILIMYLPVAIAGYMVYGSNVDANVLATIMPGPMLSTVEILVTLHLVCGFVIILNPVCQEGEELLNIPHSFGLKRVIFRTSVMGVVLFTALSVPQFGAVLSLIGGSAVTALAYIFPPIFYLKLCTMKGPWEPVIASLPEKVALVEIIFVGALVGVAATYSAFDALFGSQFSKPCYL